MGKIIKNAILDVVLTEEEKEKIINYMNDLELEILVSELEASWASQSK